MKSILFLLLVVSVLLISSINTDAYIFVGKDINDSLVNHSATAPSFYWDGLCDVNVQSSTTISNTGSYSLLNEWYSPNNFLILTGNPNYVNDITCLSQGNGTTSSDLSNFYESKTAMTTGATTSTTWIKTVYDCDPATNDWITYSNTNLPDSFGNYPYGYVQVTGGYCDVGSPGSIPSVSVQLDQLTSQLSTGYLPECGTDLIQARSGAIPIICPSVRFFGRSYWYMVPFNSGASGSVNISIPVLMDFNIVGGTSTITCTSHEGIWLWDTVTNTTSQLSAGIPYTDELILTVNRDYFLFINTKCLGTVSAGTVTVSFNSTIYNMSIFAFQPTYVCGNYSDCEQGIQFRTCSDDSGKVPDIVESRSCFDVPTFDLSLGFENTIVRQNGVYICRKAFGTCFDTLNTINAEYPENWTVFPDFDIVGIARDNFIKMSSETASVGSKSLKMWYIPPKINEPIPAGNATTNCGNATSGSFPFVEHPYNETLFIASNISFVNPFAQIRYDVRKCSETVLQYDYTGALFDFDCGKMCYASSCDDIPGGRYGLRITRQAGQLTAFNSTFNMTNNTGDDITHFVTDESNSTWGTFETETGVLVINSTENIFFNGSRLNFVVNASFPGTISMCVYDTLTSLRLGRVFMDTSDQLFQFSIDLTNITSSSGINEINFSSCGAANRNASMFQFEVLNFVNLTASSIVFDYVGFAPDTWDEGQIIHDLSNVNLETGVNYTIALSINPENQFDPLTHCAYFDNFRVTFTELALPSCESECIENSIDRRIASFSEGVCTFITQRNSPDCIASTSERNEVKNILLGLGGGDITDNSTCIDSDNDGISDDLYIFDTERGFSEIVIDSAACLSIINQTAQQARATQPLDSAEDWIDWIMFLVSPLFIFLFISLAISGSVGALIKAWEGFGITFATMLFFGMLISLPGSTEPVIPIWVGIAMITVISLLIAAKLKSFGFGGGGG